MGIFIIGLRVFFGTKTLNFLILTEMLLNKKVFEIMLDRRTHMGMKIGKTF